MSRDFMRIVIDNLREEALDRKWCPIDICGMMSICNELGNNLNKGGDRFRRGY